MSRYPASKAIRSNGECDAVNTYAMDRAKDLIALFLWKIGGHALNNNSWFFQVR